MQADPPSLYADPFDPANFAPDDSNTARLSGNTFTGPNTFASSVALESSVTGGPVVSLSGPGPTTVVITPQNAKMLMWWNAGIYQLPNPDLVPNGTFFIVGVMQTITKITCVDNGTEGGRIRYNTSSQVAETGSIAVASTLVIQSELRAVGTSRWWISRSF